MPSAGKSARREEYWVAAPRVCDLAYVRVRQHQAVRPKTVLHTVNPATLTTSVN